MAPGTISGHITASIWDGKLARNKAETLRKRTHRVSGLVQRVLAKNQLPWFLWIEGWRCRLGGLQLTRLMPAVSCGVRRCLPSAASVVQCSCSGGRQKRSVMLKLIQT
jgi:hypothetical protein